MSEYEKAVCFECGEEIEEREEVIERVWGKAKYTGDKLVDIHPTGATEFIHESCL